MDNKTNLFELALKCRKNAYAPYSNFKVGASILADDGKYYCGCNVENAAFPSGTCAEAGAVSAMIAGGAHKIVAILIVADTPQILPCGNCLQKICEFGDEQTLIYSANLQNINQTYKIKDILPHSFSAKDMDNA